MSTFTRDAVEVLRAAESALSGGRRYHAAANNTFRNKENVPEGAFVVGSDEGIAQESDARLLEVVRQLQVALNEIASLRSELAAEKAARSQTLVALGQRWKDELLAELRSGDLQLRRDVAELQYQVGEKLNEQATQSTVLRRQVEELQRSAKVRESTQFDLMEHAQEELDGLRARCEAAMAQSAATRVECAAELERERAALSHRLDAELVRLADARHEAQKDLRAAKELIREEVRRVEGTVRGMVDEAWRSCATALETAAKESQVATKAELKHTSVAVQAMQEKVEHCVRTCQGEARLLGATLQERIAALESQEAVTASRVDRAEKKSDAAHDAASRTDAAFLLVREEVDRASAVARQAAAQAQRAEAALIDRDSRLAQVELQLHSVASAEKLKAEIEACKRSTARAEGQIDSLSRVCERSEALAERSAKAGEAAADRVARCEKLVERSHEAVKGLAESQQQWGQRVGAVEDLRDRVATAAEQQALLAARLEQRIASCEGKTKLLSERLSQVGKDVQHGQVELSEQLEGMRESVVRSEGVSEAARAEVGRLEKRLAQMESASASVTADCASARATVEEAAKDVDHLRRQMQQARELQEVRSSRIDEKLADFDRLEGNVTEKLAKVERHVGKQLESMNQQAASTTEQLEATLQDSFTRFQAHIEKEIGRNVSELHRRMRDLSAEALSSKPTEALEAAVAELRRRVQEAHERQDSLTDLQSTVARLESSLRRSGAETAQNLEDLKDGCEASVRRLQQQHQAELVRLQHRLEEAERQGVTDRQACDDYARDLAQQQQQLQTRLAALADTVTASLAAAASAAATSGGPGAATISSATSANTQLHATTTGWAPSKLSTVEGSGGAHSPDNSLPLTAPPQQQPAPEVKEPGAAPVSWAEATAASTGGGAEAATHLSVISPVRASPGATAANSPGSSLAHALEHRLSGGSGAVPTSQHGHLFDSPQPTPTTTSTSRSRSQGGEEGSQPSSAGLPPPVPVKADTTPPQQQTQEPKRLPPPTTLPASADTTLLGGGSTVGQRTIISRFIPQDDEVTGTTTASEAVTPVPNRQRATGSTDELSTSLTTSPSQTPPARVTTTGGWAKPSVSRSPSTENGTNTVEKQAQPEPSSPLGTRVERAERAGGGGVSASEHADPPQASTHHFDDWDEEDEENEDEEAAEEGSDASGANPALDLPTGSDVDDAVLPMGAEVGTPKPKDQSHQEDVSSPEPVGPQATAALRATPRKDFLGSAGDSDDDPLEREEVPRHGQATTSSSSTTGRSGSGSVARAFAGSQPQEPAAAAAAAKPAGPTVKKYTYFDDSSSEEDHH